MSHKPRDYSVGAEGPGDHLRNALAVIDTFYEAHLPRLLPTPDTFHTCKRQLNDAVRELNAVLQAVRARLVKAEAAYEAERRASPDPSQGGVG